MIRYRSPRLGALALLGAALLAGGLPTAAARATGPAVPPADPTGSWIVVLKDGASLSGTRSLAAESGTDVAHVYESAVHGFAARMTGARAAELAADPRVAYVEPDPVLHVLDDPAPARADATDPDDPAPGDAPAPARPEPAPSLLPAPAPAPVPVPVPDPAPVPDPDPLPAPVVTVETDAPWALDRIDQRALPLSTTYGYTTEAANVTAYVIDTGVQAGHEEFGGRASTGFVASRRLTAGDCNGHGTHVAATIGGTRYGVAKGVKLVAVQVADCRGSATGSDVLAGIDWVSRTATAPAVANISMGGSYSRAMNQAVANSVARGITYAVAAGNDGADACLTSPASVPQVLTVGASDREDRAASFSNSGACLDLYAPGVSVTSAWKTPGQYATASGTSMASPHVAGAAALELAAHPAATPAEVAAALLARSTEDQLTLVPTGTANRLLHTLP
ncbi:S8 family peptidase [Streptomyces sp. NPDC089919]|uniref:S8 family peptidase n=1 Tax=Streptomyces sp. NPDC089919 TaxID=3155188 RepID=UPI00341DAFD7